MATKVTGIGIVSALGLNANDNWQALQDKRTGVGPLVRLQTVHKVPAGEIEQTNEELATMLGLDAKKTYSRTALLGMMAAREAIKDANLDLNGKRVGLISGTSVGGMDLSEQYFTDVHNGKRAHLRNLFEHDCGASTMRMADYLGIKDFMTTISTACSSSANAIMLADRMLRSKQLDAVVVGGTDPLCKFTINGFTSLMILDQEQCRPFDDTRNGLNLGEGAGFLVLERDETAEGKPAYCNLLGYANANDAYHQTATSANGEGPFLAMKGALEKAQLQPKDIDYINAHGTGTGNNDLSEATAIGRLFGEEVPPFSSTKVYTGHTLGACGGIEAAFCALMLKHDTIIPTFNFCNPMQELGMKPETDVRKNAGLKTVMSNSFGFGGNVSSLIFGK
ncbi:MAG: beta-ketoacyl-[acyl-carrier-protein] synthase family protein [Paludibacteraceae bacterium]|nr:beta-ketoacyl-[acyl-carrier-protein] synthase family protein [Paludibacteraceae bacterium]